MSLSLQRLIDVTGARRLANVVRFFDKSRALPDAPVIRLNTIGFLPDRPKCATVVAAFNSFQILRVEDGTVAWEGTASGSRRNADTRERLAVADFSGLEAEGEYRLRVSDTLQSPPFRIAGDVFNFPFYTVMRAMYLWRCGMAVRGVHNGQIFQHGPCHLGDAWLNFATGQQQCADATGGWHDAGDYNKYVVNAAFTVGTLFRAWDDFRPQIEGIRLDIPESGGVLPDFLAELKWELDWLFTMQRADGSVYHKVSTQRFCRSILPEQEAEKRYFAPWSTTSTAYFTAVMAQAARYFREFDAAYSNRCLAAAKQSRNFLRQYPENVSADLRAFHTGEYQTPDVSGRIWAAAELWDTTGEKEFLAEFESRIKMPRDSRRRFGRNSEALAEFNRDWDWRNVRNLGLFTYLFSQRPGRNEKLVNKVWENSLATADEVASRAGAHGYARPLDSRYYWGSNGTVARQTLVLQAAHRQTSQPKYVDTCLDAINYLFGRNCYGRSFVTGLGDSPPLHPHDRRSIGDDVADPWPGYLVGGAQKNALDWSDTEEDYFTNEIAINWNAALVYALAGFVNGSSPFVR